MRGQGELQAAAEGDGADGRDCRDGQGGNVCEGGAEEGEESGRPEKMGCLSANSLYIMDGMDGMDGMASEARLAS